MIFSCRMNILSGCSSGTLKHIPRFSAVDPRVWVCGLARHESIPNPATGQLGIIYPKPSPSFFFRGNIHRRKLKDLSVSLSIFCKYPSRKKQCHSKLAKVHGPVSPNPKPRANRKKSGKSKSIAVRCRIGSRNNAYEKKHKHMPGKSKV